MIDWEKKQYTYNALTTDYDEDEAVQWMIAMILKHDLVESAEAKAWVDENGLDLYPVLAAGVYPMLKDIVTSPDFAAAVADILKQFRVGEPFAKWLKQ